MDVERLRDPFLPSRHRHDDLESRSGRQLRLNGLVQQGFVGIVDQPVPFVAGYADGEIVGIKSRTADHGKDLAGARIHGHDCAILAFQRLFGGNLQVDVDRQLELLAGYGRGLVEPAHFLAAAVHQCLA